MFNKITKEQMAAIESVKANGINEEELKNLEMAGVKQELIDKLSSSKTETEVDDIVKAYLNEGKPWAEYEKPESQKNAVNGKKEDKSEGSGWGMIGLMIGGAFTGAITGFKHGKIPGAIAGFFVGAGIGAGSGALTGCAEGGDTIFEEGDTNNNTDVGLTLIIPTAKDETLNATLQEIKKQLEEIKKQQKEENKYTNQIVALLMTLVGKVSNIENQGATQTQLLNDILSTLNKFMTGSHEGIEKILTYLTKISGQLQNMSAESAKAHREIIAKLTEINGNMVNMTLSNQSLFNELLSKLDTMSANDAKGLELLAKILDAIKKSDKNNTALSVRTHELLGEILNRLDSMDSNVKSGLSTLVDLINKGNTIDEKTLQTVTNILSKLNTMTPDNKADFGALLKVLNLLGEKADEILEAINKGNKLTAEQLKAIINNQNAQSKQLDDVIKLIVENNNIAQGTQNAVNALSKNMTGEHKEILNAIKEGKADVDAIQKILAEIAKNTKAIPDIKQAVCVMGSAIEKLLSEVQGMRAETKTHLLQILAKIPDGCNCKETDLSGVIALLNKILDQLQKDPTNDKNENSDESILTDLDKYFK